MLHLPAPITTQTVVGFPMLSYIILCYLPAPMLKHKRTVVGDVPLPHPPTDGIENLN